MKIKAPQPFTFEGGERAVLMLHGFTGHSGDVRMLGRYLEQRGYTCHAPIYKGHGAGPEQLVHTGPEDWWKDVRQAYQFLKDKGHEKIAVVGLSLGGVFSLKLAYSVPVIGVVPMCAPMTIKSEEVMYKGVLAYAREYKRREGKAPHQIEKEMLAFQETPMSTLRALQQLIRDVRNNVDMIYAPTFVVQARHDEMINPESATIIYNEVESSVKQMKWYEESSHVITMDKQKNELHEDVYQFLERLDW